jgi:AraC-like DNA-binding protein
MSMTELFVSDSRKRVESGICAEKILKSYEALFLQIPDIHFFAKDKSGKFFFANPAFANRCGFSGPEALIGLTDLDIWPLYLGEKYRADDKVIFETGIPCINVVELVFDGKKATNWFSTTKLPIFDDDGAVAGIVGSMRDLKRVDDGMRQFTELGKAFEYMMANYREHINIKKLAAMTFLSVSQFERRFKFLFKTTPSNYLTTIRIQVACRALAETSERITVIADEAGFYDPSHMNRLFKLHLGLTPTQYRQTFQRFEKLLPIPPLPPVTIRR